MIQCSFCGHANEDGTLCCEQCKTDLSIPEANLPTLATESFNNDFAFDQIDQTVPIELLPETTKVEPIPLVEGARDEETLVPSAYSVSDHHPAVESIPAQTIPLEKEGSGSPVQPTAIPSTAKPKLIVIRGEKIDMDYPIYPGKNYIGRTDEKPVDIDLENQEPKDRIWSSRQHAIITFEDGIMTIEDLNSLNGTFVNRTRVHPGQIRTLQSDDIIQIGTVQMKVVLHWQG